MNSNCVEIYDKIEETLLTCLVFNDFYLSFANYGRYNNNNNKLQRAVLFATFYCDRYFKNNNRPNGCITIVIVNISYQLQFFL